MENTNNFDNLPTPAMFLNANGLSKHQLLEEAKRIIFEQVSSQYESDLSDTSGFYILDTSPVVLNLFIDSNHQEKFDFLSIIREPSFPKVEFTTWLREHHWKLSCLVDQLRLIEIN